MDITRDTILNSGVESTVITEHQSSTITPGMPIEINVEGNDHYIDLDKSHLYVKGRILAADGSLIDTGTEVGPVNNLLHSIWRNVKVSLNQTLITDDPDKLYPYLAYVDGLFNYNGKQERSMLQNEMWYRDTPGSFDFLRGFIDSDSASNKGLYKRTIFTKGSKIVEMSGPLYLPLRKAEKLLLNFVNIHIRLEPNDQKVILLHDIPDAPDFKFEIQLVEFRPYRVQMRPNVLAAYNLIIPQRGIDYTYMKPEIKRYPILKEDFNVIKDNIFNNRVPFAFFLFFVEQDAFQGAYNRNMFQLQHFQVRDVIPTINGHLLRSLRDLKVENMSSVQQAYGNFVQCVSAVSGNRTYGEIEMNDFKLGYFVLGGKLTCDEDLTSEGIMPEYTEGSFKLEIRFADTKTKNIEMFVIGYFTETLNIDNDRNVTRLSGR